MKFGQLTDYYSQILLQKIKIEHMFGSIVLKFYAVFLLCTKLRAIEIY